MSTDQIPSFFAGLVLTPGQFDLFEEVEEEAIDLFDGIVSFDGVLARKQADPDPSHKTIVIDCGKYRVALAWTFATDWDVLGLGISPTPSVELSQDDIDTGTELMGLLYKRAKALFDRKRTVWQIAMLPLSEPTMRAHAQSITSQDGQGIGQQFLTFEPNRSRNSDKTEPVTSSSNLLKQMQSSAEEVEEEEKPSLAMQVSALAISSAFVFVTPPVGVAMLTYAALRQASDMDLYSGGEDAPQPATSDA